VEHGPTIGTWDINRRRSDQAYARGGGATMTKSDDSSGWAGAGCWLGGLRRKPVVKNRRGRKFQPRDGGR